MAQAEVSSVQISQVDIDHKRAGLRALGGAWVGFFVDMFDVYLPIVALGPAMVYFNPATLSPTLKVTLYYIVFALSLIGRPVGATLFGHLGDKLGRRRVTIVSMAGFAICTFAIGLLPGYEAWGLAGMGLLIFLRFVDGVFLGGGYTGANPLAMEYAPKGKRGKWAAIIHTGFPLSVAAMSLLTAGLLKVIPAGSLNSPYVQWGWRLPFFLGGIMAAGICIYYVRKVKESDVWVKSEKSKSPLRDLFQGDNFRRFIQVFVVMSGAWFTLLAVTSILPGVLLKVRHVDSMIVTDAQLVAYLVTAAAFVPIGMLGEKIGRRKVLIMIGLASCTVGPFLYYLLVKSGYQSAAQLTVLVTLINLCSTPFWAIVTSYLTERFPTNVRASGYGIGYSLAIIIPAFSSFYMLGLKGLGIPYEYTQLVILALGGILLLIGALSGPETKHVEF